MTIQQQGSNRQYIRETDPQGNTFIRTIGTNIAENRAFIYLCRHFEAKGLPVPHILWVSEDEQSYTQTDLGDTLLLDVISNSSKEGTMSQRSSCAAVLARTLRALAHVHKQGAEGLDWSRCFPIPAFDKRSIFWDLNYYKYCYLKLKGIEMDEVLLEDDFEALARDLLQESFDTFMYRDFQSRNVMVKNGEPYFIDFQGGRKGPIYYDLASFLWQARAHFTDAQREELVAVYEQEAERTVDPKRLRLFVLFRQMQTLGAYGFRGLIERKPHFLESLPIAEANMRALFEANDPLRISYPYIASLC